MVSIVKAATGRGRLLEYKAGFVGCRYFTKVQDTNMIAIDTEVLCRRYIPSSSSKLCYVHVTACGLP